MTTETPVTSGYVAFTPQPRPILGWLKRAAVDLLVALAVLAVLDVIATERLVTRLVPGATCALHAQVLVWQADAAARAKSATPNPKAPPTPAPAPAQ